MKINAGKLVVLLYDKSISSSRGLSKPKLIIKALRILCNRYVLDFSWKQFQIFQGYDIQ
jgi:hypothetical protein